MMYLDCYFAFAVHLLEFKVSKEFLKRNKNGLYNKLPEVNKLFRFLSRIVHRKLQINLKCKLHALLVTSLGEIEGGLSQIVLKVTLEKVSTVGKHCVKLIQTIIGYRPLVTIGINLNSQQS